MKIAFCSQEYPPETAHGGIATQTHAKAHGLAALGHEVHVIAHGERERSEATADGVHVIRIPGFGERLQVNTEPVRWLTYSALVAAEVASLHRQVGLDVVDFPEFGGEGYVHLLNQTPWSRIPTVIHLHGPLAMLAETIGWPEKDSELHSVGTAMEGTSIRLADAVLSSSRTSALWCQRHYGLDAAAVEVIHTGVDVDLFRPVPKDASFGCEVVFVGRVAASKGADTLVNAACLIAREFPALRVKLLGRGDPAFVAQLRVAAGAAGFPQLLMFGGQVPRDRLAREMAHADVFASPSRYEGGPGFVCLEAMACGLPVVACSGSGVAENIEHGQSGMLVSPGDELALAETLRELLHNATLRRQLGAAARKYVEMHADTRTCIRRLDAFYRRVLQ